MVPMGSGVQRSTYLRVRDGMCATAYTRACCRNTHSGPPRTPPYPGRPQRRREIFIWPLVLQEFQAF